MFRLVGFSLLGITACWLAHRHHPNRFWWWPPCEIHVLTRPPRAEGPIATELFQMFRSQGLGLDFQESDIALALRKVLIFL
jgi:hypothetical protein